MKTQKPALNAPSFGSFRKDDLRLMDDLHREFRKLDLAFDASLSRAIINFVQMKSNFASYQMFQTQRRLQVESKSRLTLIRGALGQSESDEGYFDNPVTPEFVRRNLLVALIERAILIAARENKNHPKATLAFSFHLSLFKEILKAKGIEKPIENITAIFEKTGAVDDIGGPWALTTIRNKISEAKSWVNLSKEYGACHDPKSFGDSPKVRSPHFIRSVSGWCEECKEAWGKALNMDHDNLGTIELAARELSIENPELRQPIIEFMEVLGGMPLPELYDRIPKSLRGIFTFVIP